MRSKWIREVDNGWWNTSAGRGGGEGFDGNSSAEDEDEDNDACVGEGGREEEAEEEPSAVAGMETVGGVPAIAEATGVPGRELLLVSSR
jgi:hypothetical protein